jgi:pimeloyl-ACP methyl ester carboxylesterase
VERRWAQGVSEEDLAEFLRHGGILAPGESPRQHPRWPVWVRHRWALAASFAEFDHRDDLARLRSLARPALLVVGEGTARYFRAISDALGRELPEARLLELPGGHAVPVVSMERFLEALRSFLAGAAR